MKKEQVVRLIERVRANFPNYPMHTQTPSEWSEILKDTDFDMANRALSDYIRQGGEFPPNAGQIFSAVERRKEVERRVAANPGDAFRKGVKCKYCNDNGFVIVKKFEPFYGREIEVAQVCGECNRKTAEALQKGGYQLGKEWIECTKQEVEVFTPFKKAVGETPFD